MRHWIPAIIFAATLLALCNCVIAKEQNIYALRSAYLYYFSHFITWPDTTIFPDNRFILCAITDDSRDRYQLNTIENKSLGTNSLKIKLFGSESAFDTLHFEDCHMIYISAAAGKRIEEKLQAIPVTTLMVTEGKDHEKGVIHLFKKNNKLNFEIDHNALTDAGYTVSSKLLRLAKRESP